MLIEQRKRKASTNTKGWVGEKALVYIHEIGCFI